MKIYFKKTIFSQSLVLYFSIGILILNIVFYIFFICDNFYGSDYGNYIQGANSFLSENPYSTHGDDSIPDNFRPPGYPFIIAFFKWLSPTNFIELIVLTQAILLIFVYITTLKALKLLSIYNKKTISLTLLLFIHPVIAFTSVQVQTDFFLTLFITLFCFHLIKFSKFKANKNLILSIIFLSASIYFRPTYIYFVPILLIVIFLQSNVKIFIYSFLTFIFIISPWSIRNKITLNTFSFSGLGNIALTYYAAEATRLSNSISAEEAHLEILKNADALDYINNKNDLKMQERMKKESIGVIVENPFYFFLACIRGSVRVFLMPHNIFEVKEGTTMNVDEFIKTVKNEPSKLLYEFNLYFLILYVLPYLINIIILFGILKSVLNFNKFYLTYHSVFLLLTAFFIYSITISGPINRAQYMISYILVLSVFLAFSVSYKFIIKAKEIS